MNSPNRWGLLKSLKLVPVLCALAASTWSVQARADKTITVGQLGDTAQGQSTGPCSLRMAIEKVNGGSNSCTISGSGGNTIISLSTGTYTHTGSNGPLQIKKSVIILGAGGDYTHSILTGDLSWGGGLFVVPSGLSVNITLKFQNLEIKNSKDTDVDGAALFVQTPASGFTYNTTLDDVQVDNCRAWQGGAVRNLGGTMTVVNSYFHDNHAATGGAIASGGKLPGGADCYLDITASHFENNAADQGGTSSQGGAIQGSHNTTVKTSTFNGNSSLGDGGALYCLNAGGDGGTAMVVDTSTLNGNSAVNGGAIYEANPCSLSLHNTTVSGNTASTNGGGIYGANYIEMFSSTIASNRALGGLGGGVYMASASGGRTNACIVALNTHGNPTQTKDDYKGAPHGGSSSEARSLFSSSTGASGLFTGGLYPDLVVGSFTLSGLASNGGPTKTHAINASSQAYNKDLSNNNWQSVDQRNVSRPRGGLHDLGAFEF